MATLPSPLAATQPEISGTAGRLALYEAGSGSPVLLIHSINAAASADEVRPLFERLSVTHRVFAIDLPGYGRSQRGDRHYDIALFTAAIDDALDAIGQCCGDAPVDLLAVSLSGEFAARAAVRRPHRIRTLTLVTPTGLDRRSAALDGAPGQSREVPGVHVPQNVLDRMARFDDKEAARREGIAISRTRLHQLCSGSGAPPTAEQLERLASVLGVSPGY
ncbi:MAG: alpha/beta fold hydrolase, partial [Burkholderiales bacterium]